MKSSLALPFLLLCLLPAATSVGAEPTMNPAVVPATRNSWLEQHNRFNALAKKGDIDLVFIGDSITEGWGKTAKALWAERFAPLKAANFGISGDATQHVLWRLQNGNLDGIHPRAAVVLVGTNNLARHTPEQVAEGVATVLAEIRARCPETKVLLFGLFPRGEKADDPVRAKLSDVNRRIATLEDGRLVFFMDIGERLLREDGSIAPEMMPDFLHPTRAGYTIWADAIQSRLPELMR